MSTEWTDTPTSLRALQMQVLSATFTLNDGQHVVVVQTHTTFPERHPLFFTGRM